MAKYDANINFIHKDWATMPYDISIGTVLSLATGLTNRMVGLKLHKYASTAQVLVTGVSITLIINTSNLFVMTN